MNKKSLFKQFQRIIYLFGFILIILPISTRAETIPTPQISGRVYGANDSDLAILVTWEVDDKNEYGFKIEKEGIKGKEMAGTYNPIELGDEDKTPGGFYLDTALVSNDTYTYWVSTFDRAGNESAPAKITLVAAICQPEFTVFEGQPEANTVNLAWNSLCSAVEYKLYRDGRLITSTDETSFIDKDVSEGDHEYKIEAYDEKLTSYRSLFQKVIAAKEPVATKTIKVNVKTVTAGSPSPTTSSGVSPAPQGKCAGGVQTQWGWVCNIGEFISKILAWAVPILSTLAVLMLIYAGYIYTTSQGNPDRLNLAKEIIIGVIVGFALIFLAEMIFRNIGIEFK